MSIYSHAFETVGKAFKGVVHELNPEKPKTWAKDAELDWQVVPRPVEYRDTKGRRHMFTNRSVLTRSDNGLPLSVVSKKFKVVQPAQIIELFGQMSDEFGFKVELAGQANYGRRFWAMAKTPFELKGSDKVGGYMLWVTGVDRTLSTQGVFTALRASCANMLARMVAQGQKSGAFVRVPHHTEWKQGEVVKKLTEMDAEWKQFASEVDKLKHKKVTAAKAEKFLLELSYPKLDILPKVNELKDNSVGKRLIETYNTGVGQRDIKGTAWGLVNAVSRFVDHESKAQSGESRIARGWIGDGMRLKQQAHEQALLLA